MENWRVVKVYARKGVNEDDFSHYEVSDQGRVRLGEKIYALGQNKDGYQFLGLWSLDRKVQKYFLINRLVAFSFLGAPPPGLKEVHHKNHKRHDNRLENLEFSTRRKNMDERSKNGSTKKGPEFDAGYQAVLKMGEGKSLDEVKGMAVAARLLERRLTWEMKHSLGPYLEQQPGPF